MQPAASSWSFEQDDLNAIVRTITRFLGETGARSALLVDRSGQLVTTVGEALPFDPMTFATLTAADFSANDQLARMIGEPEFGSLFHQGEKESMYLADIARRVILVVLFDNRTTLGLVKLRVRGTVVDVVRELLARGRGEELLAVVSKLVARNAELEQLLAHFGQVWTRIGLGLFNLIAEHLEELVIHPWAGRAGRDGTPLRLFAFSPRRLRPAGPPSPHPPSRTPFPPAKTLSTCPF